MRELNCDIISDAVAKMCIDINLHLPSDLKNRIASFTTNEPFMPAKSIMLQLQDNAKMAEKENIPICQDTGMIIAFLDVGQDLHICGGNIEDAINKGVAKGYTDGYLRKSVVKDPIDRKNTQDNTPAVIHYNIVPGDKLTISLIAKGFGSENMSASKILIPSEGMEGVKNFVVDTVVKAGARPCPPLVIGVGIGGSFEKCAILSKKALLRNLDEKNPDPFYAKYEQIILDAVNKTGIGPQGFGGLTTALAVNILTYPTHITSLPVAVNIGCHVTRHASIVL